MNKNWFKPAGIIYRPISWQGWLFTVLTWLFCLRIFISVDFSSYSVSDTLYGIFPYWVSAFLLLGWIAGKFSQER